MIWMNFGRKKLITNDLILAFWTKVHTYHPTWTLKIWCGVVGKRIGQVVTPFCRRGNFSPEKLRAPCTVCTGSAEQNASLSSLHLMLFTLWSWLSAGHLVWVCRVCPVLQTHFWVLEPSWACLSSPEKLPSQSIIPMPVFKTSSFRSTLWGSVLSHFCVKKLRKYFLSPCYW